MEIGDRLINFDLFIDKHRDLIPYFLENQFIRVAYKKSKPDK